MRFLIPKAFVAVFFSGAVALAQQPEKPDPLGGLLQTVLLESNEVSLHITVLKVPKVVAADKILDDDGQAASFWGDTLMAWKKDSLIELVSEMALRGTRGEVFKKSGFPYRYISQDSASHLWDDLHEWKARGGEAFNGNGLLQELREFEVGSSAETTIAMKRGADQARLTLNMRVCPPSPDSRPVKNWPLPLVSAPRYFFRPWSLQTAADVPVERIFLLGGQMEPPNDGQAHTGYVLMAFARLSVPAAADKKPPSGVAQDVAPVYRTQTWTVSVPLTTFHDWLRTRKNTSGDSTALKTWLDEGTQEGAVEVLATSILAAASNSGPAQISSVLLWHDTRGYEPSGNPYIFSPLSCDGDQQYRLSHDLEVSLELAPVSPDSASPAAVSPDPFSPPVAARRAATQPMAIEVNINRPSSAARWVRGKIAFERTDAADPQALEVAEADIQQNELVTTGRLIYPGHITLASASLKDGRVHANFLRVVEETSEPTPAALQSGTSSTITTWIIETPLSWRERLLTDKGLDLKALGAHLLSNVGKDGVDCVGLIAGTVDPGRRAMVRSMRPRLFFGGNYLNSAVHKRGIYFNPRDVEMLTVGAQVDIEFVDDGAFSWELHSADEPQTRHWGIWQPDLPATTGLNSGTQQPTHPVCDLKSFLRLTPNQPEVVAVVQTPDLGAAQPVIRKLRWHVVRVDPAASSAVTPTEPVEAEHFRKGQIMQATLLKRPAGLAVPEDRQAAAAFWLNAARQGKVATLDSVTLNYLDPSYTASIRFGWEYYFPNGRDSGRKYEPNEVFHASAEIPAGTEFANQIDLSNRLVGCQFQIDGSDWTLTRDARAPIIVTDTFANVTQEWPGARPDGPTWEQLPKTRVSVQRPIFSFHKHAGTLPPVGVASVTDLEEDTVLVIRVLR